MNNITSLYKRHKIIYTDPVPGKFNNIRIFSMSFMTVIFFILPWITYNKRQAIVFDISNIKFYFFNLIFWPQDFVFFAIIIIILILLLFAVTVYTGRIWCGFLCPQSIWIRIVNFITRNIEGNRIKRFKNDNTKYNKIIIYKKILKHSIIILFSCLTALTFIGYFFPIKNIINVNINSFIFFWIIFFTLIIYFNIYWFKEQFCFLVCPYARLQCVMFDEQTLIVTYDEKRGEKRGHRNKSDDYKSKNLGDCIDCKKCVTCCPTGIDIRDGLQIECISCAACIDACDTVMKKMNYPTGLIKYSKEYNKTKVLNIRFLAYLIILFLLIFILLFGLSKRDLIQLNISRNQTELYNINKEKNIENFYILKITNKSNQLNKYNISLCEKNYIYNGLKNVILNPEEILKIEIKISSKNIINKKFDEISLKIENLNDKDDYIIKKTKFISPN